MPVPGAQRAGRQRPLAQDVVLERLLDAMIDGTLSPGDILRYAPLTAWLGVSRRPIRDALQRLRDEGLVEIEYARRTRVAPLVDDRLRAEAQALRNRTLLRLSTHE